MSNERMRSSVENEGEGALTASLLSSSISGWTCRTGTSSRGRRGRRGRCTTALLTRSTTRPTRARTTTRTRVVYSGLPSLVQRWTLGAAKSDVWDNERDLIRRKLSSTLFRRRGVCRSLSPVYRPRLLRLSRSGRSTLTRLSLLNPLHLLTSLIMSVSLSPLPIDSLPLLLPESSHPRAYVPIRFSNAGCRLCLPITLRSRRVRPSSSRPDLPPRAPCRNSPTRAPTVLRRNTPTREKFLPSARGIPNLQWYNSASFLIRLFFLDILCFIVSRFKRRLSGASCKKSGRVVRSAFWEW